MATLAEQLDAMLALKPNWDGYDADAPIPEVVTWAKDLVTLLVALERASGLDRDLRVYPTRIGGVQIEWDDGRYERELELMPDGSIEMLHVEKATGAMREEKFAPGQTAIAPGLLTRFAEFASTAGAAA